MIPRSAKAKTRRKFPVLKDLIFDFENIIMFITFVTVPIIMNGTKHHLMIFILFLNSSTLGSSVDVAMVSVIIVLSVVFTCNVTKVFTSNDRSHSAVQSSTRTLFTTLFCLQTYGNNVFAFRIPFKTRKGNSV